MDAREKLIELIAKGKYIYANDYSDHTEDEYIADTLLDNGVTVQECEHWVSYQSDKPYGSMDDKEWYRCSKCGEDAHGRCYEDEWYSAPILSAYCPHCGAKMMPQPPKGE